MIEEIVELEVAIARLKQAQPDEWEASGLAEVASTIEEDKLLETFPLFPGAHRLRGS